MKIIVELILAIILALVVGLGAGYWLRKRSAEAQIGSAEVEAKRIITEAEKQIETKKKEATLEAKEEIHRMRQELDRDTKDRRNELSRQERRLVQKEENLDRKIDSLERKEEILSRKVNEIDKSQARIDALHAKQMEELERISGLTAEDARAMLLSDAEIEIKADASEPFAALAFKIMVDPFVGRLAFCRIYSGTIENGMSIYNTNTRRRERVGRILRMHANKREEMENAQAGLIVAIPGLKQVRTGDTLCDEKRPVLLENLIFPEPVISLSVEPMSKADQIKLAKGLEALSEEDPTFRVSVNEDTGQTLISGMGELHLEIIVDRLRREFNVEVKVGRPQVAYREAIRKPARAQGKFVRQSGGKGQYGDVVLEIEPLEDGKGFEWEDKIVGGVVPKEYIPAAQKGVEDALNNGVLGGYPVIGIRVALVDGSYHEVDSSEMAFRIAGSMAIKEALKKADPVLMEPVMNVEVVVPEEYMGDVIGDLSSRRGRVAEMGVRANARIVKAFVPLAEMFGYATDLRSKTSGRASYTMSFDHYEEVPRNVAEELLKA